MSQFNADFTHTNVYSEETGFTDVKFAGNVPLLETELKEVQEIKRDKIEDVILNTIGNNVILDKDSISLNAGVLTISDTYAVIEGRLIYISNLEISVVAGDTVYIDIDEVEVTSSDAIHKWGNQQETVLDIDWTDARIGEEISRRIQVQFDLTKSSSATTTEIAQVKDVGGSLTLERSIELRSVTYKVFKDKKPTINDYGYEVGTLWIYDKNIYILVDNAVDDAVWESIINDEKIKRVREYGLRWNKTTDTYTRLGDAQGLEVQGAGTTGEHLSDFDDVYPYSEMKRCNMSDDGVVNAYYGDPDYATDGSNGMVMVEMVKHYYKTGHYTNGSGEEVFEFWIADGKKAGYEIEPNFYRDGSVKDKIYLGAVEGNVSGGKMRSIFGVQPTTEYTIGQFRGYAEARGAGWTQRDLLVTSLIQRLMIIEYGTFNLQSVLSEGITNLDIGTGNHSQNTGYTDSLGNHSGEVIKSALDNGATGASETYPFSYRGIENPYGNTWEFADGFIIKDDGYYFEDNHNNFNDTGSEYNHINVSPLTDSDGYVDNLQYLSDFEFAFIPKSIGGTSSTHITDYVWSHDAGEVNIARVGAYWFDGLQAGAFSWVLSNVASYSYRYLSARLLYIPQE